MKRRTTFLVLGNLLTGVTVGSALTVMFGGFTPRSPMPAAWAGVAESEGGKAPIGLFEDAIQLVRADYVEPIGETELVGNAINGMLTALDPHSYYLDPKAFRDLQIQTRGNFGGLGMEVTEDHGRIKVVTPLDGTPAQRSGIKAGDHIFAIDGRPTAGLTLS
jgi:carboxyl-terminal processing protease